MVWQMEDINLLGKRDVVTLSTSGGAIVDWSIIGAPQLLALTWSNPRLQVRQTSAKLSCAFMSFSGKPVLPVKNASMHYCLVEVRTHILQAVRC